MDRGSPTGPEESPEQRWVRILTEYLPKCGIQLPENQNVLNIGCGNDVKRNYLAVAIYVARQGVGIPFYVGVDLKEETIAHPRRMGPGLARDEAICFKDATCYPLRTSKT